MTQPYKLMTIEQAQKYSDGYDLQGFTSHEIAQQLADTMREDERLREALERLEKELEAAKVDIEMLYKSREEYMRENGRLRTLAEQMREEFCNIMRACNGPTYKDATVHIDRLANIVDIAHKTLVAYDEAMNSEEAK